MAQSRLWIRRFDSLAPEPLDNTDGATYPFWSPDGAWLGFIANDQLKKISLETGLVQILAEAPSGRGASWGSRGQILFSRSEGPDGYAAIFAIDEGGGSVERVTEPPETGGASFIRYPHLLPDGRSFLYLDLSVDPEVRGAYVAGLDDAPPVRVVADVEEVAFYAPSAGGSGPGYLVFRRGETLIAQPFDAASRQVVGRPTPIATGVGGAGNTGFSAVSVSPDATLAYSNRLRTREIVWLDRSGEESEIVVPAGPLRSHDLAPDDSYLAFTTGHLGAEILAVHLQELPGGAPFPFVPAGERGWDMPIWSRDATAVAYTTRHWAGLEAYEVWVRSADLSSGGTMVASGPRPWWLWDWSPDGRFLLS